ncbi:helix-turn-helix domain-containing protein [Sphingomonas sp.]|uniref:helix-turn-helix domain-containing protein n=1 Tax=Sphingomonas sp. TaxID=28214 RepID=UPI00289A65B6|nr:helix-turn-helix domain-containing protein [Sphingomonas sp.]
MIDGRRIAERLTQIGLSQSALARRIDVSQQTIHKLIVGKSRGSTHIHRIARELQTTPAYLTGETDDPDENAPPPPPQPAVTAIMMPMVLPPVAALKRMFDGMLTLVDQDATPDEQALQLAEMLPTALSRVRDLHFGSPAQLVPIEASSSADAPAASGHPEPTR